MIAKKRSKKCADSACSSCKIAKRHLIGKVCEICYMRISKQMADNSKSRMPTPLEDVYENLKREGLPESEPDS